MGAILFTGVTKTYGDTLAVDHVTLSVADGELLVLLGPSGCGKTTLLRLVAGLEDLDEGTITIGGTVVNDIEPKDRDVAMVFQSYALYPHLTVAKNIEFPLRQRGIAREERLRRVNDVMQRVGIEQMAGRKPGQLSGGQRQRVALARAIVRDPQAFLMDEPLSNLDAALRVQTRADIVSLQQRLGTTTLYVTHDQVEAMTMGHRIAVMNHGSLQQVAPPQEAYDRPANTFVAAFLGSPGMNLLPATLGSPISVGEPANGGDAVEGLDVLDVPGGTIPLPRSLAGAARSNSKLIVGIRPEALAVSDNGSMDASVVIVEALGAEALVMCELPDESQLVVRQDADRARPRIGDKIRVRADPTGVHLFDADTGLRVEDGS
ncbi:MAG: ABC transporter ATP-binding protein [Actinomycetota bacterium]|nr:ABC transporter ATP-binding protein [Actinomycetota bacterium]